MRAPQLAGWGVSLSQASRSERVATFQHSLSEVIKGVVTVRETSKPRRGPAACLGGGIRDQSR